MFDIGDILKWYPGESDYPSIVIVVDIVENLVNGYLDRRYLVTYSNVDDVNPWIVREEELYDTANR